MDVDKVDTVIDILTYIQFVYCVLPAATTTATVVTSVCCIATANRSIPLPKPPPLTNNYYYYLLLLPYYFCYYHSRRSQRRRRLPPQRPTLRFLSSNFKLHIQQRLWNRCSSRNVAGEHSPLYLFHRGIPSNFPVASISAQLQYDVVR